MIWSLFVDKNRFCVSIGDFVNRLAILHIDWRFRASCNTSVLMGLNLQPVVLSIERQGTVHVPICI